MSEFDRQSQRRCGSRRCRSFLTSLVSSSKGRSKLRRRWLIFLGCGILHSMMAIFALTFAPSWAICTAQENLLVRILFYPHFQVLQNRRVYPHYIDFVQRWHGRPESFVCSLYLAGFKLDDSLTEPVKIGYPTDEEWQEMFQPKQRE